MIQSCTWDFSKDGGAIGIMPTKIVIPKGAQHLTCSINVLEDTYSSAGFPDINIETSTGFVIDNIATGVNPITDVDGTTNLIKIPISNGLPLNMRISTDALISGKIEFSISYIEGKA
ncbi:MAG TPA: hypothetical protein VIY47_02675 [Ignavibacteriaceae bacterium]